jgi:hypothetical protein
MNDRISCVWTQLPTDPSALFTEFIENTFQNNDSQKSGRVFFRADDIAVFGRNFDRLMTLFLRYDLPLCLAVVPAWLTKNRWRILKRYHEKAPELWCWHQHGWRHVNHQLKGKKSEFAGFRTQTEIKQDLLKGKSRIEDLMGEAFYPVFTPPWNRCSEVTLTILKAEGYYGISRMGTGAHVAINRLPEYSVDVDLHTRKCRSATEGWKSMLNQMKQGLSKDICGIMIHHQRMNDASFDFLELMLNFLKKNRKSDVVHFKALNQ